jgi:hypothetical protein
MLLDANKRISAKPKIETPPQQARTLDYQYIRHSTAAECGGLIITP